MMCERCKKEIKKLPLSKAIKKREWWKQEFKDFGWSNFLILLAILLIFSGFYFEFGPKIKNPCDWCKIKRETFNGETEMISCSDWTESMNQNIKEGGEIDERYISTIPTG